MHQTATHFCPQCSVEIPADALVCPHCRGEITPAPAAEPKRDSVYKYLDNPWWMLGLLFFVTAGLGLPFLWKSKAFGPVGKWVLTLIMLVYTGLILWAIGLLLIYIGNQFYELYQVW